MTNSNEYTREQLESQRFSLMNTIHLMRDTLNEDAINTLYNKVASIQKEIDSMGNVPSKTDILFS